MTHIQNRNSNVADLSIWEQHLEAATVNWVLQATSLFTKKTCPSSWRVRSCAKQFSPTPKIVHKTDEIKLIMGNTINRLVFRPPKPSTYSASGFLQWTVSRLGDELPFIFVDK